MTAPAPGSCDADGRGILDVDLRTEPEDECYTVSQDTVPGLDASYDLANLPPAE